MKKVKILPYLLLVTISVIWLLFSCSKGDTGLTGAKGDTGETGATGAVGATGADGTKVYSGTVAPATTIGTIGDFYINLTTSDFYGPKSTNGWGTAISLKGQTGAAGNNGTNGTNGSNGTNGTNGSRIYSGAGAPAASVGVDGDYYLDVTNYLFYGPKASGTWTSSISLKGAKGDKGDQGDPGTANVIYSSWVYATNFSDSTIDNSSLKVGYVKASALTTAILNSGTVLVYFTYGGGTFTLPYTSNAGSKPNTISYTPMLGKILITRFTHDNSNSVALSTLLQYRYILIPGGVSTLGNVDLNDYQAVKKVLNLKD